MKIGLVTYHHSSNVGAMLQTYATCRALKELGHEVIIVDIRQTEDRRKGLGGIMSDLLFYGRNKKYEHFEEQFYPPLTRRYYTMEELQKDPPQVDCLIVGSDQTWNPNISKGVSMAYFLDFGSVKTKRLSYASSFGMDRWNTTMKQTEDVGKALHRFSHLSVREKTGATICKETFGLDAKLVVDPTMLFDSYPELTGDIRQRDEVVCYKLQRNEDFYKYIGEIRNRLSLPIRLLNNAYPVRGMRFTSPPGVSEWIRYIGGARFVVTDSFHGVVFSLLYKRNFVVIKSHNGRDSRFVDLLIELGLGDRIFESVEEMCKTDTMTKPIDYAKVKTVLERLRKDSWDYLREALKQKK